MALKEFMSRHAAPMPGLFASHATRALVAACGIAGFACGPPDGRGSTGNSDSAAGGAGGSLDANAANGGDADVSAGGNGGADADNSWAWATKIGPQGYDYGSAVAAYTDGSVYVTGSFTGTATFGSTTLTSSTGLPDMFLAKYDSNGSVLWAKNAGATMNAVGRSVAVLADGSVYVTGGFAGKATFGSTTLTFVGGTDIFLVKYDSDGNAVWARRAGSEWSGEEGKSVAVLADGSAYVTGSFTGSAMFGSKTLTAVGQASLYGGEDVFLAKYDNDGNVLWATSAGGTGDEQGRSVAVLADGSAYVTGSFGTGQFGNSFGGDSVAFGTTTLVSASYDIFLAKFDANGAVLWAKSAGGDGDDAGNSVAILADGSAYVTGAIANGDALFGSTTITAASGTDIFLAKYDGNGNVLWARSAGGTGNDGGYSVAARADGSACITGAATLGALFGSKSLSSTNETYLFLASYDPDGNVLWARSVGGTGYDYGQSLAALADGSLYVTGVFGAPFGGTTTFGTTAIAAANESYIFLAKRR
jgi:hypothetical protein